MAHTHHCDVCKQPVAICDGDICQQDVVRDPDTGQPVLDADGHLQEQKHYCTVHHPDPQFKVEDKPTVRMTVRLADD